jgi:hypothetical protein
MKKNQELLKFNERLNDLILAKDDFVDQYAAGLMKDDERAHIEVDLAHGAEIYDPYSSGHDLSRSLFASVESSVKYLRVSVPVSVDFLYDPHQSIDQTRIQREFKGNYRFAFDEKRHEIAKCNHSIIRLYIIGVLLIILTMVLTGLYHSTQSQAYSMYFDITSQVTSIASWVFIWDAVDKQAFEKRDLKKESLRAAQLCGTEVHFVAVDASPSNKEQA